MSIAVRQPMPLVTVSIDFPAPPTRDEITQAFRDLDMNGFRA